jgi:GNAT superfamily N-acetyltransferase
MAALRVDDLPGYEHFTPWLGGVYVAPEFRKCGIGRELCSEVERQAKEIFNISKLYLFTLDKKAWYKKLGWHYLQPCAWCGYPGDILFKNLLH